MVSAGFNKSLVPPQSLHGLSIGCILWIRDVVDAVDIEQSKLPRICLGHPCVVIQLNNQPQGFVRICVITSMGGNTANKPSLPLSVRRGHVPIYPKPINPEYPGIQLRLENNIELRKDCYVNIQHVYSVPTSMLERYSRRRPVRHYRLDAPSIRVLAAMLPGTTTAHKATNMTPLPHRNAAPQRTPPITSESSSQKRPHGDYEAGPLMSSNNPTVRPPDINKSYNTFHYVPLAMPTTTAAAAASALAARPGPTTPSTRQPRANQMCIAAGYLIVGIAGLTTVIIVIGLVAYYDFDITLRAVG